DLVDTHERVGKQINAPYVSTDHPRRQHVCDPLPASSKTEDLSKVHSNADVIGFRFNSFVEQFECSSPLALCSIKESEVVQHRSWARRFGNQLLHQSNGNDKPTQLVLTPR